MSIYEQQREFARRRLVERTAKLGLEISRLNELYKKLCEISPRPVTEAEDLENDCSTEEAIYTAALEVLANSQALNTTAATEYASTSAVLATAELYVTASYTVWQNCVNQ